jgi:hypothetical protein
VNLELLGMADREQAGVLEAQRKQAGMTILSALFDSLRRYRKIQGRVLLGMIQKYVPEGRLIRIDQSGGPQYAKFVKDPAGTRYDIIVDEAPTSTNAKERAWIMITQLMPMMQHLPLPPDAWLEILKYSPLPDTLMEKIQQMMQQAAQHGPPPDPKMVKVQQDGRGREGQATARAGCDDGGHRGCAQHRSRQSGEGRRDQRRTADRSGERAGRRDQRPAATGA